MQLACLLIPYLKAKQLCSALNNILEDVVGLDLPGVGVASRDHLQEIVQLRVLRLHIRNNDAHIGVRRAQNMLVIIQ